MLYPSVQLALLVGRQEWHLASKQFQEVNLNQTKVTVKNCQLVFTKTNTKELSKYC